MYRCYCKYTGSSEVKEPSDWRYVKEKGTDNKHFWQGYASLGDGYECMVQHFKEDGKETLKTDVPMPFIVPGVDTDLGPGIDSKLTEWTDAKEGFDYKFECASNQEIKIAEPDWKLDSSDNTWKGETWLGDGWACNCYATPKKADSK